jgi:hypothetical protein
MSDPSGNCNPVLADVADQTGYLGYLLSVTASCTDPNALDTLVYTDNTSLFVVGAADGSISYTPTSPITEKVEITCSDSEYTDTDEFTINVNAGSGYVAVETSGESVGLVTIDFIVAVLAVIFVFVPIIALALILDKVLGLDTGLDSIWKKITGKK